MSTPPEKIDDGYKDSPDPQALSTVTSLKTGTLTDVKADGHGHRQRDSTAGTTSSDRSSASIRTPTGDNVKSSSTATGTPKKKKRHVRKPPSPHLVDCLDESMTALDSAYPALSLGPEHDPTVPIRSLHDRSSDETQTTSGSKQSSEKEPLPKSVVSKKKPNTLPTMYREVQRESLGDYAGFAMEPPPPPVPRIPEGYRMANIPNGGAGRGHPPPVHQFQGLYLGRGRVHNPNISLGQRPPLLFQDSGYTTHQGGFINDAPAGSSATRGLYVHQHNQENTTKKPAPAAEVWMNQFVPQNLNGAQSMDALFDGSPSLPPPPLQDPILPLRIKKFPVQLPAPSSDKTPSTTSTVHPLSTENSSSSGDVHPPGTANTTGDTKDKIVDEQPKRADLDQLFIDVMVKPRRRAETEQRWSPPPGWKMGKGMVPRPPNPNPVPPATSAASSSDPLANTTAPLTAQLASKQRLILLRKRSQRNHIKSAKLLKSQQKAEEAQKRIKAKENRKQEKIERKRIEEQRERDLKEDEERCLRELRAERGEKEKEKKGLGGFLGLFGKKN